MTFQDLVGDPEEFDGRRVGFEAVYLSSFEVSVLASGFTESFPPQAVEPTIWVSTGVEGPCVERGDGTIWADRVIATGVFRSGGGFGHLGAYRFELRDPTLACR